MLPIEDTAAPSGGREVRPHALACVILAAGAGTRFGEEPKLLTELEGRPLLQHALDAVNQVAELDPVVLVLGARADRIRAGVRLGRARPVTCADWAQGLSASLRCGLAALPGAHAVLVALGDNPGLSPEVIRRILAAGPGTRASYGGVPGHPVLLGPGQLARVNQLQGDRGARDLLADAPLVECGDIASGADVDTPADLSGLSLRRPG